MKTVRTEWLVEFLLSRRDYQTKNDVMARRAKTMATLSHFIEVYDAGGEAALGAALDQPESRETADLLKHMAEHFKVPLIDLIRTRSATAQKRQASGIY